MKITIIGVGGVGGYFGAKLIQAGYRVSFLARGKHLEEIRKSGIGVESIMGNFNVTVDQVSDKISDLEPSDLIILGLKTWQISELAPQLSSILHENSVILTLQNGVSIPDELKALYPDHGILAGVCKIISKIKAPGIIEHQGVVPEIVFGEWNGDTALIALKLKDALDQADIKNRISKDIQADLWKKFIGICLGGLLANNRCTYGELSRVPRHRREMIALLEEIHGLSKVIGVNLQEDFVQRLVPVIESFPPSSKSSMARDMEAGLPSELDYQNGTVVKLGLAYNFPTPINSKIYQELSPLEQKSRA